MRNLKIFYKYLIVLLMAISCKSTHTVIEKTLIDLFLLNAPNLNFVSKKNLTNSLKSVDAHPDATKDHESFELYTTLVLSELGDKAPKEEDLELNFDVSKLIEASSIWGKSLEKLFQN